MWIATSLCRLLSHKSLGIVTLESPQTILDFHREGIMNRGWLVAGAVSTAFASLAPWSGMAAESTAAGAEKVMKETQEAIEATKEYTAHQKKAFQQKAQEELVAIQRQIIGLREKIAKASESTRADLQKSLNELEKKKDGAKERLDELKEATDLKWHEIRVEMNDALNELKHSYQKLLSLMP
jgi:hypothetical protein